MSYIGKTPTPSPLTANDITDGIISESKLGANSVTTGKITDGTIAQADISDQAINEAKMQISNAPTNGYMLTAQSGNTGGLTWAEASTGSDFTPNFFAYLGSSQTLATNTTTLVTFNTDLYDSDSAFNTTSYNFTIPSGEAGKYVLYFQLRREAFAGARFFGTIIRTRSGTESDLISAENNGGSDAYDTVYSMIVADCLAGDTFHVIAKHNDSGNRSIYGGTSSSFFGGYKLV